MFVFFTPETLASSYRDCVSLKKNLMDIGMRNQAVAGELPVVSVEAVIRVSLSRRASVCSAASGVLAKNCTFP